MKMLCSIRPTSHTLHFESSIDTCALCTRCALDLKDKSQSRSRACCFYVSAHCRW